MPTLLGMNANQALDLIEDTDPSLRTEIVSTDVDIRGLDLQCNEVVLVEAFNDEVVNVVFNE